MSASLNGLRFDSETNGLLPELDRIHCLCLYRPGETAVRRYHDQPEVAPRDGTLAMALEELENADEIIAHNLLGFDYPALKKVYPGWEPKGRLRDSLVIARSVWPDEHLTFLDAEAAKRGRVIPKGAHGRHSLSAWGIRLRDHKGQSPDSWAQLTAPMLDYCAQDVSVLDSLVRRIQKHEPTEQQIELEQEFSRIVEAMTQRGFRLNQDRVMELVRGLTGRRAELTAQLSAVFTDFQDEYFTPKRRIRKLRTTTFNPNSRAHVARALTLRYGWKPKAFTPTGEVQVDEAVMAALPYPEAKLIHERMTVQKRLGTLIEGKQAWLKLVAPDSRVRGRVAHCGAVTSRCTHSKPNLGNVERRSATSAAYRACWEAGPGNSLVIVDASGIQARVLGHYAWRFDDGHFARTVLDGDVHSQNREIASAILRREATRDEAKEAFYAMLFGAQGKRVGSVFGVAAAGGDRIRTAILDRLPGLKKVIAGVEADAQSRGWLRLLDGRRAWVRSKRVALVTLAQGGEAVLMKQAHVLGQPWTGQHEVMFVHDEIILEVPEAQAEEAGAAIAGAIVQAGVHFRLKVPLEAHVSIGKDWSAK